MSRRAAAVPNAWDDDDWVSQADKEPSSSSSSAAAAAGPPPALNRQERLQQHAEANRRLWEDSAETFHYIEATSGGAPLAAAPFRPQVKVLSRKPAATAAATDDDADADSRRAGAQLLTPEEIRAKQRRERDEKQRRYDEARAKIFGESAPSSRGSSPGAGAVTPPRSDPPRGGPSAARARGRGNGHRANSNYGGGGYNSNNNSSSSSSNTNTNINHNTNFTSYPSTNTTSSSGGSYYNNGSSGNHTPGPYNFENRRPPNPSGPTRELYDPNSSPKPDPLGRGRGSTSGDNSPRVQTPRADHPQQQYQQQQQAIRSPRGPDSSGRGGFGLARRGARET